ncbi:MAG TPA: N-6 DNA methylase [Pyrinomonadaceae bacterium]|nr:N-6 DNA methylase [Pyrinomonadaceae bacterium]
MTVVIRITLPSSTSGCDVNIDNNLGTENADSFRRDLHKDLKADYVLANPLFNDSDWGGAQLREDVRVCGCKLLIV